MYLADEGNANYYQLPSVTVDPADAASTYISLDPAGKCHSVYVSFTNLADVGPITVTGVSLNQQVPLDIDPVRFAYILAVLLLLYAVRPQSMLFSRVFDGRLTLPRVDGCGPGGRAGGHHIRAGHVEHALPVADANR